MIRCSIAPPDEQQVGQHQGDPGQGADHPGESVWVKGIGLASGTNNTARKDYRDRYPHPASNYDCSRLPGIKIVYNM